MFRTAFLSAGLTGDFGGTWSLTRLVGAGRARHLFFLNEKLSAASAAAMGLVGEVVPDGALMDRVADIAGGLAQAPPHVIAGIKQNLNDAQELALHAMLNTEADRQVEAALRHLPGRPAVLTGRVPTRRPRPRSSQPTCTKGSDALLIYRADGQPGTSGTPHLAAAGQWARGR